MKMLKNLLLIVALLLPIISNAQEQTKAKPQVCIDYFQCQNDVPFEVAEELRRNFIEGVLKSKRVDLIDVDALDTLRIESECRKSRAVSVDCDDYVERLKLVQQAGSDYIILGFVTSATTVQRKSDSDSTIYYDANIVYTVKAIELVKGKTVFAKTFKTLLYSFDCFRYTTGDTPMDAFLTASYYAKGDGKKFAKEAFPLIGHIFPDDKSKGDKVESFYIDLGEENGVALKDKFEVCIVREVAKRRSLKPIGECYVGSVGDGTMSICKVRKGGKEIKDAIDTGLEVVVRSKI